MNGWSLRTDTAADHTQRIDSTTRPARIPTVQRKKRVTAMGEHCSYAFWLWAVDTPPAGQHGLRQFMIFARPTTRLPRITIAGLSASELQTFCLIIADCEAGQ